MNVLSRRHACSVVGRCLVHPHSRAETLQFHWKCLVLSGLLGVTLVEVAEGIIHLLFPSTFSQQTFGIKPLTFWSQACISVCLCHLSLNQDQTDILQDKRNLSSCYFNQTRGHTVTFILSLSPLWECFLIPCSKNIVPWGHNLPCSYFSSCLFNKNITLSSAQSNWQCPHVTWTVTYLLGKYLSVSLFLN